jgi:hypothetical protein
MASIWYASKFDKKQFDKLCKKYKITQESSDSEDSQDSQDDFDPITISGFKMTTFGVCCRKTNSYILGIEGEGIDSSDKGTKIVQLPNNSKNGVELLLFCREEGLPEPALYLVPMDCRVCGS